MSDILNESFYCYLEEREIYKVDSFQDGSVEMENIISKSKVIEHLALISDFHASAMGYRGYMNKRLENNTGKKVEQYKVYLKKIKRDIAKFKESDCKNNFEDIVAKRGDEFVKRAEACLKEVFDSDYYSLINRSMRRIEICLGNTGHTNIRRKDHIEVIDLSRCCYDMVECDALHYLSRLKRAGINLDWEALIKEFCLLEELNSSSERFIKAMLSYPYEFMKCCNRYRYRKKEWSDEEYEIRLLKSIEKDSNSIISF